MDSLTSFTHINDSIPDWLARLDDLATQVAEQHSRFTRLTHFSQTKLARVKHDSTESLRPKHDDDTDNTAIAAATSMPPEYSTLPHANLDGVMAAKDVRKRKPGSSLSGASGPPRYRTRSMIIVWYDSAIQEGFEVLVRSIATARNNLRKAKTAASFKARMASLGMEENPFAAAGDFAMLNPKLMRATFERPTHRASNPAQPGHVPAFVEADKELETAQSLCEVAAHQFLRDGDCTEEINGAKARFAACLQIAQREIDVLQEQKPQESAPEDPEDREDPVVELTPIPLSEKAPVSTIKPMGVTGIGSIEVDNESDASSVHIDLSAFRRPRRV